MKYTPAVEKLKCDIGRNIVSVLPYNSYAYRSEDFPQRNLEQRAKNLSNDAIRWSSAFIDFTLLDSHKLSGQE